MVELTKEQWLLSILATVILGALGSGLWEALFKPFFRRLSKVLFTLLTFGVKKTSDRVYREAALGHHELPSLYVLLFVISLMIGFLLMSNSILFMATGVVERSPVPAECTALNDVYEKRACVVEHRFEGALQFVPYILVFMSIFFSVVLLYRFLSINRTNLAVSYFQQCRAIVAPYMSDGELKLADQAFALIENKEMYDKLISQLTEVAANNKVSLPEPYVS